MTFELLPLTWNAVATLLTGFAAVGGAVFVGRRQLQITTLQTSIQQQQIDDDRKIRQNELKIKLLERRSDCIDEIKKASGIYTANVRFSDEDKSDLFAAIRKSELIFPPQVVSELSEALWKTHRIPVAYQIQGGERRDGNLEKADKYLDEAMAMETEVFEALPKIAQIMVDHARIEDWD